MESSCRGRTAQSGAIVFWPNRVVYLLIPRLLVSIILTPDTKHSLVGKLSCGGICPLGSRCELGTAACIFLYLFCDLTCIILLVLDEVPIGSKTHENDFVNLKI